MAEATVSSTIRESAGSMTMHIVTFSSLADTNTYASGISGVIGYWCNAGTDESTAGDQGINVAESSGTFTFSLDTTATDAKLYVLSKS